MAHTLFFEMDGPVHFGTGGEQLEAGRPTAPAGTLYGAVLQALDGLEGHGAASRLAESLERGTPPFLLSSLMPHDGKEPWLPLPLLPPPARRDAWRALGKPLKRLEHVPLSLWKRLVGHTTPVPDAGDLTLDTPYVREVRPRVALDRITSGSALFACGGYVFRPGAGLWCLVEILEPSWEPRLGACLNFLGDEGLGAERTYGFGRFYHALTDGSPLDHLPAGQDAAYMALSEVWPAHAERERLGDRLLAGRFDPQRGWAVSPAEPGTAFKRRTVEMLCPGSMLGEPLRGACADVTPDPCPISLTHKILRPGFGVYAPVPWKEVAA
jgi:CRISPR-associated protein Csm4